LARVSMDSSLVMHDRLKSPDVHHQNSGILAIV
jgi:hypothetical protein